MKSGDILLGVNIDHVATLRQARGTPYPRPVDAALLAEIAGADSITVHLREDRRHIQDADLDEILALMRTRMNLEMAVTDEMLAIAERLKPTDVCLVPEKREELTTEGGLDVAGQQDKVQGAVERLNRAGIRVSLFIDPDVTQIEAAAAIGAPVIEIHTGAYAEATGAAQTTEFERIVAAARHAHGAGLVVNAGHGLHYDNVGAIARIAEIMELNIGHAIVSQSVFDGLAKAVADMKASMLAARAAAA